MNRDAFQIFRLLAATLFFPTKTISEGLLSFIINDEKTNGESLCIPS